MFQISENKVSEEQILLRSGSNANLYGILYHARNNEKGALVICPPDGDERTWSHRTLVNLSRLLASHGYTVLRFDYMGQGESEGAYEESTLTSRLKDTGNAVEFLLTQITKSRVGLLGLRLGGTLAALTAVRHPSVEYLVLWEPVVDLSAYLYNLLRVNISFQMVMYKTVLKKREQLQEDILSGGKVSINGFYLTKGFFQEAMEVKLNGLFQGFHGKHLTVLLPGSKPPVEDNKNILRLEFPVFWKEPKVYYPRPKTLMEETLKWISENGISSK